MPPGLIVPRPTEGGDPDVTALSLTLFYSALNEIAGADEAAVAVQWVDEAGGVIPAAWKESDTARQVPGSYEPIDFTPRRSARNEQPFWPRMLLVALGAMLAERILAVWRELRRGRAYGL